MTTADVEYVGRLTGAGALALKTGGQRIVVVGAGGWLGMATLELLWRLLGAEAFADRVAAFGSRARVLDLRGDVQVAQQALPELSKLAPWPSVVLHLAYLTQEKANAMSAAAYAAENRALSKTVLDALDRIGAEGVFIPSSGAVYKADDPAASPSMRLYGRLKRDDEAMFGRWAEAPGKRAVIARVFNLSGPYINKQSSYALASFVNDALSGRPIEIKATRPVYRSYVAISELMSVVIGALTDEKMGSIRFDTAGDHEYEMSDIAGAVIEALGAKVGILRPSVMQSKPDWYVGDGSIYRRLRSQTCTKEVGFDAQIREVAAFMRDSRPVRLASSAAATLN